MYKPYQKPVINAFADVKVAAPKISNFFILIVYFLSKIYFFILFGFAKIQLAGDITLFNVFKKVLKGESRCIIAFRHPDGREPQLLLWLFLFKLKKLARKKKVRFSRSPHVIFVYGYEVARWGGRAARFFMPKLGAIPIHHTKMDSKGMFRIYSAIQDGPYPLAIAPEGQVSYSTDNVPRLEPGIARIGFQAAEKIKDIPLEILPVSIHFRYGKNGEAAMEKLLRKIEKLCGFSRNETKLLNLEQRLNNNREYILKVNEKRYGIKSDNTQPFEIRLQNMTEIALSNAERMSNIKPEGDFFARLYKVRHECWDNIFLPNNEKLNTISKIKRCILDLKAGEAWHINRHQEIADFAWYFNNPLPNNKTTLHKRAEYIQNLWDFANRTMGGAFKNRINIPAKKVIIKITEPVNLTERLGDYKNDKKGTVANLMEDLKKSYLNCIREVNKEY